MQIAYRFEGLERTALIADEHFVVERIVAGASPRPMSTQGRPLILMSLDAPLEVKSDETSVTLARYQTALIPAASPWCTVRAVGRRSCTLHVRYAPGELRTASGANARGRHRARTDRFVHGAIPKMHPPGTLQRSKDV